MSALFWIGFTASGAAALALELLWMRSAALAIGQTAATTASAEQDAVRQRLEGRERQLGAVSRAHEEGR